MRRDADIIGYVYNDTEQKIREKVAEEIEAYWEKQVEDGIGVNFDFNSKFCFQEAAAIARNGNDKESK